MSNKSEIAAKLAIFTLLPCFIVITVICLAIPLLMLTIGIMKMDDCKIDSRIPIWMIVIAILMFIERFVGSINTVKDRKFLRENPKPSDVEDGNDQVLLEWKSRRKANKSSAVVLLGSLIRFIQFIATIVGCFWVFGIYSESDQCNGLVFWTSYIYCVLSVVFYIFGACVLGCVCCFVALLKS